MAVPTQPDTRPDTRVDPALRRLIAVVLLGGTMGIIDATVVAVGVRTLTHAFRAPLSTVSWVSTGYLLALVIAVPVTSWAADRIGARRLWLAGLLLFLAASLGSALAWSMASLIVFRIVQGMAAGILDPLVLTLLARAAGPARVGRVMGLMGVVLSAGPVLGLIIGGAVVQGLSWRWMFLINLPVGAAAVAGAVRLLPADSPHHRAGGGPASSTAGRPEANRLDVLGLLLIGPASALLVLALSRAAAHASFDAGDVIAPLAGGVVLLAVYGVHALRPAGRGKADAAVPGSRRAAAPLIDLRLFTHRPFTVSVAVMTLIGLANFANFFVLPLYYQQLRHHGPLTAALLIGPYGIACAIAMPLAGRLSDRRGARRLAAAGAVPALAAAIAMAFLSARTPEAWPVLATVVIGAGLSFVGAPTMGSLYRTLPPPRIPQGSSVLYMLNQLGAAVGIAAVTLILSSSRGADPASGYQAVYTMAAAATAAILLGAPLLPGPAEGDATAARGSAPDTR